MDKQFGLVEVKVSKDEDRVIEFVATNQIVDYDGDVIEVEGMSIKEIKKNKSFLWSHQGTQPPIGKILKLAKVGKKIIGKAQLTSEEEYPFGFQIYKLIKGGYINNVSMSFLPNYDTVEYKEVKGKRVRVVKEATMLEVSAVNIGANKDALITSKSLKDMANKSWDDGVIDGEELNTLNDSIDKIEVTEIDGDDIITDTIDTIDIKAMEEKITELEFLLADKEIDEEAQNDIYEDLYNEYRDEPKEELTIDDLDDIL